MNIACNSCPAKYAVPDEKVRGRKVRITCKRCGTAIVVDGTALPAAGTDEAPSSERERQRTILGGLQAPFNSAPGAPVSEHPPAPAGPAPSLTIPKPAGVVKAPAAGGFAFPSPTAKAAGTATGARSALNAPKGVTTTILGVAAPANPPVTTQPKVGAAKAIAKAPVAKPVEPPWTVAVTDDDHRDMTIAEIVAAYSAKTVDAETFIWRDGMADWLTPFEIPEIANALKAKGLAPRTNEAPQEPEGEPPSGAWHEPGKWNDGKGQENAFEDVTVAMAAPKAQALLEAVTSAENAARAAKPASAEKSPAPKPVEPVTSESLGFGPTDPPNEEPAKVRPAAGRPAEEAPFKLPFEAPEPAAVVTSAAPARAAVVARRAERAPAETPDLFSRAQAEQAEDAPRARMPSVPPDAPAQAANMTGARNESSVLFSLDQLSGGNKAKPKAKPSRGETVDADALLFGASGGGNKPSMATLGGGALFAPATMAAPDIMAPPPVSAPRNATPSSPAAAPKPVEKSRTGLWAGLLLVALAGGGAVAFVVLKPHAAPAPTPSVVETAAAVVPEAPSAVPAEAPSAAAPEAPAASAEPAASAAASASGAMAAPNAAPSASAVAAAPGTPAAATKPAMPAAPGTPAATPAAAAKPAAPAAAKPAAASEGADFDRDAASAALAAAAANAQAQCASQDGTHGTGKVAITFAPSGRATNALVSGDFAGSALGGCVARVFRSTHVPAFAGDPVRVSKTVRIP